MNCQALIDYVRLVPDVVWSGAIAAIITLSGVVHIDRSNTKRLRLQLDHDDKQKTKDRANALRREVCLEAATELTKVNGFLANLTSRDLTKTDLADGFHGFHAAVAKLQLVAEPDTALLVNKLSADYGALWIRLSETFYPLLGLHQEIAIHNQRSLETREQCDRISGEMNKLYEATKVETPEFAAHQQSRDMYGLLAKQHEQQRDQAQTKANQLKIKYFEQLLSELDQLHGRQIEVLVAIRKDLGFSSNIAEMKSQMSEQRDALLKQIRALLQSLKELLPDKTT